jgi:L-histidine N-alpha-methyltransferase
MERAMRMMNVQPAIAHRQPAERDEVFARDVITGLSARPKRLPPKYFYDATGARLFEKITALPEYYPTRSELAILREHAPAMAHLLPPETALIEFGSGSTRKVRLLIDAAPTVAAYVPVDISAQWLAEEAARLRRDYPQLAVLPVAADFTQAFRLPAAIAGVPRAGFFPGSTIGNFEPHQATAFLHHAARILGEDALLIVGIDLVKDVETLTAAYNDAAGVTAAFNLNLLARINRELGADFDLSAFSHQAFYNRERARIEMHLVSRRDQRVNVGGRAIQFRECETIHTENSYKYTADSLGALARRAGWMSVAAWTDADGYFSVQALRAAWGA